MNSMRFFSIFAIWACLSVPPTQGGAGADGLVDYILLLAKEKICKLKVSSVSLPASKLPSHVEGVEFYDFSSLKRLDPVTIMHNDTTYPKTVDLSVKIGLSTLTVDLDLKFVLHGKARIHINSNYVKVGLRLNYYNDHCEIQLTDDEVSLRDVQIDAWDLTLIGDKVAKDKIRDAYNENVDKLEKMARDFLRDHFNSLRNLPLCQLLVSPATTHLKIF